MMAAQTFGDTTGVMVFRDADGHIAHDFVLNVSEAIALGQTTRLRVLVENLHESDLGDLIEALDPDERPRMIELLGADFDFTALTEVDDTVREDILEELPNAAIAEGVKDLDSDDAIYILEDLDQADREEVLEQLPALERVSLTKSLDYPDDSAGRRMQTEFIAVPQFWTVGQTIDYMRETPDLPDRFFEIFVIDPAWHLAGVVPLDRLLRSARLDGVRDLMETERHHVLATDDQEDVARQFERYNLVSAAVLDETGRLVGVMTVDDILDVIEAESDEDLKALGGVKSDEELSDTVWTTARGRFSWLFINLLTAILASMVIGMFQKEIQTMVALAVLMPIISSQGGNAGTQTMTVVVRALAVRELGPWNMWRIIGREVTVGLINGLAFALIMGLVAVLWFGVADLGLVIGLAMTITLVFAALGGILIPIILDRFDIDPAVSSGPFVTTVTDVVGFFTFLGIATLWFG